MTNSAAHSGDAADACGEGGGATRGRDDVLEMWGCVENADAEVGGVAVLWVFAVSGLSV